MKTSLSLGLLVVCLACSGGGGPADSVKLFYDHLNQGNYTEAMSLYSAEAMETVEDLAQHADISFEQFAETLTNHGTLDGVKILDTAVDGQTATVQYRLDYGNGSSKQGTVELTRENGEWKLGLVTVG